MFAKVFGQIYDSSIAEDYNCRRMFMDLLVLADPTGAVDMTHEAIARRTNVPLKEVQHYIGELCQPDAASRSQLHEGKRLIPLDSHRDWGWQIVNYAHYRKLRDQETLRAYFRDAQRESRRRKKAVKDNGLTALTSIDNPRQSLTPSSSSSSVLEKVLPEGVWGRFQEWMKIRRTMKKVKFWDKLFESQANWLKQFDEPTQLAILDQSIRNGWQGLFPLKGNENRGAVNMIPECLKMPNPRDWQEAKRIVKHLRSKRAEHPAYQKQIDDRIEALTSQFKLQP